MNLAERDIDLRELMDDPDCDPARLRSTLERFDTVNRLIAGWGAIYRRHIGPHLAALDRPARVLDLGCGGGDVITRLAHRAVSDGFEASWLGVDPDPRAIEVAARRARIRDAGGSVRFERTDSTGLIAAGETFDIVLSNHVLHHLGDEELASFTEQSRELSCGIVLHGDIERGRIAYGLYTVAVTPLAPGSFLRTDGLRSIRRSYRPAELARALGPDWRVQRPAPFRVLASADGSAAGSTGA